jgi:hypothetical protein
LHDYGRLMGGSRLGFCLMEGQQYIVLDCQCVARNVCDNMRCCMPCRRMGGFTTVGRTLVNQFTLPSVVLFTNRFDVLDCYSARLRGSSCRADIIVVQSA